MTPGGKSQTAWERWELASLEENAPAARHPLAAPATAAVSLSEQDLQLLKDAARQEGHRQGFEAGRAEGLAAGAAEGAAQGRRAAEQLLALCGKLDQALAEMDPAVADELTALALAVAREVVRKSIAMQPDTVNQVVREALLLLPHQHASIFLHPEDASLVRSHAGDALSHAGHRIHEDPKLQRGDVVIEAGGAHVDATVATRWRRVVETLGSAMPWQDAEPST